MGDFASGLASRPTAGGVVTQTPTGKWIPWMGVSFLVTTGCGDAWIFCDANTEHPGAGRGDGEEGVEGGGAAGFGGTCISDFRYSIGAGGIPMCGCGND